MNEKLPTPPELCRTCPRRNMASRIIGKLMGESTPVEGCEGKVAVSHGSIVTQTVFRDTAKGIQGYLDAERAKPAKGTWTNMSVSSTPNEDGMIESRYNRTDLKTGDVCGRDPIVARDGEVPFDTFGEELIYVGSDGRRHADRSRCREHH